MSERMSQLEKFNNRMGKRKADDKVLHEANMKSNTVENKGKQIANKVGISTEDIFAVITRESLGPFVQMWNNSMETTVKETLRTEMKEIVREVVQEEMQAAFRGIVKGLMPIQPEPQVEYAVEEPEYEIRNKVEEIIDEPVVPKIKGKATMEDCVVVMLEQSIDPRVYKNWKKVGGRASTLAQGFMKDNRGIKGAFKLTVEEIMLKLNK